LGIAALRRIGPNPFSAASFLLPENDFGGSGRLGKTKWLRNAR
jgi:hypothetical protein